jgi:hypothetical protein
MKKNEQKLRKMNYKDCHFPFHEKQQQEPRQLNEQKKFHSLLGSLNLFASELGTIWNANKFN